MSAPLEQTEPPSGYDAMLDEARRIVDAARLRGLTLRLVGGLAVGEQCRTLGADASAGADAEPGARTGTREHRPAPSGARQPQATGPGTRRYRDIDLVCLRQELKRVTSLLTDLGFAENRHYRLATSGQMAQFYRPCVHREGGGPQHADDRIDLYIDTFRLDHQIALKKRLGLEDYTAPASDVLLVKLQRASVNDDDLGDMVALLRDLPLTDHDAPGAVNAHYIARLCARDWGLHHDVTRNLELCRAHLSRMQLDDGARRRVLAALDDLQMALRGAPKSPRWRVRGLFGEAFPWHDTVDEREGVRIGHLEGE